MVRINKIFILAMVVGWMGLGVVPAHAKFAYLGQFKKAYPEAKALHKCTVCHTETPKTNSYGDDFATHKNDFKALEDLDSDGDTFKNLAEINKGTWPGDKTSHPAEEEAPFWRE